VPYLGKFALRQKIIILNFKFSGNDHVCCSTDKKTLVEHKFFEFNTPMVIVTGITPGFYTGEIASLP
jgi:hypothetical protein